MTVFIPGNVPSSKNSKVATTVGKGQNKKTVLLNSKTVKNYLRGLGIKNYSPRKGITEYATRPNVFREIVGEYFSDAPRPLVLGFNFVRDTQRKFDIINAMQLICDLLVAHDFIEDDNAQCLIPVPMMIGGSWYSVYKEKPGVHLKIIRGPIPQLSGGQA